MCIRDSSILGTSGIVEPMSQQAILDTIQLEMNQAALRAKNAPGPRRLVLALSLIHIFSKRHPSL